MRKLVVLSIAALSTGFVWLVTLAGCGHDEAVQAPTEFPLNVTSEPSTTTSATSAPSASSASSVASATMDAGQTVPNAEASIARLRPGLRSCYNKGLAADPTIAGRIIVRIKVAGDGTIVDVSKFGGTGLPPEVEACMIDRVKKATFDAPRGLGSTLQVPITFIRQSMPLDAAIAD